MFYYIDISANNDEYGKYKQLLALSKLENSGILPLLADIRKQINYRSRPTRKGLKGEKMSKKMKRPLDSIEVRAAKGIAEVISDSVKELPQGERNLRLKAFCDALSAFLQLPANTSSSSRSVQDSEEVSLHPSPSKSH